MIDIPGINIKHEIIDLEDSTDHAHILTITDCDGKSVTINISFGKIV